MTLRLTAGGWQATLFPARGGAIAGLQHDGRDVLRPLPAEADIIDAACLPLVPYANRIAYGRFAFEGEAVTLPPNFGDRPHPLHGVGWRRPWQVEEQAPDRAILHLDHAPDAEWPWRFAARQTIALGPDGLDAALELVNQDDRAMPGGLGFHPYVATDPGSRLRFAAEEVWMTGDEPLPQEPAPADTLADWRSGAPVTQPRLIDHCHAGWTGEALVRRRHDAVRLTTEGARFVHIYSPPGRGFVGVEPVTHMPDAVNRPEPPARTGLRRLEPGEAMRLRMRIGLAA